MLAAKTASAPPSLIPSTKCCRVPTPPEAMTGIETDEETAFVSVLSNPSLVPSLSMLVNSISPAPCSLTAFTHSITSIPVLSQPPYVTTSHELNVSSVAFASTATTNAALDGAGLGIGAESIRKTIIKFGRC